jgi:hypothetical protein
MKSAFHQAFLHGSAAASKEDENVSKAIEKSLQSGSSSNWQDPSNPYKREVCSFMLNADLTALSASGE